MTTYAGRFAGIVMMLAQTGSPSRAVTWRDAVGIFQTAVTPHTGNRVNAVLGVAGTAEIYLSVKRCISAVVAVVTAAVDIRINRMGVVETGVPGKGVSQRALSHRHVGVVILEAGVALGAPSPIVSIV
jgi:hypothetical protein